MDQHTSDTRNATGSLGEKVALFGPVDFVDVLAVGTDIAAALAERGRRDDPHGRVHPGSIVESASGHWILADPATVSPPPAPAPEIGPDGAATVAGDVYGLGAALVAGLTGQPFAPDATEPEPSDTSGVPDTSDTTATATATATATGPSAPTGGAEPGDDRTLPEVMASFLALLRATLATDPTGRPAPDELATALAGLRTEADQAVLGGPALTTAASQIIMIAADGTLMNAQGQVIGTTGTRPRTTRQRIPVVVAILALVAAVGMGIAFAAKGNNDVAAPPATAAPTTTLPPATTTTTTEPPAPTTTVPFGLIGMSVDMSRSTSCRNCSAALRALPQTNAAITAQFPDKTALWAQCFANGDSVGDGSGYTSNQWLYISGPGATGWLAIAFGGRQTYGLKACPPAATPAPTTTAAPPTTPAPTTAPTTPPTTPPTTLEPTTTTTRPTTTTT